MGIFNFVFHHHPLVDPSCMLAFDIQQYNIAYLKKVGEEVLKDGPFYDATKQGCGLEYMDGMK